MDSRTVIAKLERSGWVHIRTRGSHHHFRHPDIPGIVTVAHPNKDIKPGTLKAIERQSGIKDWNER